MPGREKVITEIIDKLVAYIVKDKEKSASAGLDFILVPFNEADFILQLLKKQEPVLLKNQHKPYGISTNANSPWVSRCPKCGKKVEGKLTRFCKYCGKAVKWK